MIIQNKSYEKLVVTDLFVCVLKSDSRSYFLFKENINSRNSENTVVFKLGNNKYVQKCSKQIQDKGIKIIDCEYRDSKKVEAVIRDFLKRKTQTKDKTALYIDYSSMPRSWCCPLPIHLREKDFENVDITFFYVLGNYPDPKKNQTSGIDNISVFSGSSLPAVDIKRFHIMGLGFDKDRTETVKNMLEPDSIITCCAYNPTGQPSKEKVTKINADLINESSLTLALPINNFSGMVDKLCDLVCDCVQAGNGEEGQVIIVPDGPRPLIMAMSLIPDLLKYKKRGITCLLIWPNLKMSSDKVRITPHKKDIFGFQILHDKIS